MKLGVIGSPIEHSKSPEIHTNFANQFDLDLVFDKYLVNKDECLEWIKSFFEYTLIFPLVTLIPFLLIILPFSSS